MELNGNHWSQLEIIGDLPKSIEIKRNQQKSAEMNRNHQQSTEIRYHTQPLQIIEVIGKHWKSLENMVIIAIHGKPLALVGNNWDSL